jgi:hypothetical protein
MVRINIENFEFEFWGYENVTVVKELELTRVLGKYEIPQRLEITKENYQSVVDRAKRLQIFN